MLVTDIRINTFNEFLRELKYNTKASLDPYMRGRMDDAKSYAAPVPVGGTMEGGSVGEVIASNSPDFKPGDHAFATKASLIPSNL